MHIVGLPSLDESKAILTHEELELIKDESDIPILAYVKTLSPEGLEHFDRKYRPKPEWCGDYILFQKHWLEVDNWLLGNKLGRSPTESEMGRTYKEEHLNHLRFRAFFVLKYPDRVEERVPSCARLEVVASK